MVCACVFTALVCAGPPVVLEVLPNFLPEVHNNDVVTFTASLKDVGGNTVCDKNWEVEYRYVTRFVLINSLFGFLRF